MTSRRTKESCIKKGIKACPVCGSPDWYYCCSTNEPEYMRCEKCGAEWEEVVKTITVDLKARNFEWKEGK